MSNKSIILCHLYEYIRETDSYGKIDWSDVMAFCVGYYGTITIDIIQAVMELERTGAIIPPDRPRKVTGR